MLLPHLKSTTGTLWFATKVAKHYCSFRQQVCQNTIVNYDQIFIHCKNHLAIAGTNMLLLNPELREGVKRQLQETSTNELLLHCRQDKHCFPLIRMNNLRQKGWKSDNVVVKIAHGVMFTSETIHKGCILALYPNDLMSANDPQTFKVPIHRACHAMYGTNDELNTNCTFVVMFDLVHVLISTRFIPQGCKIHICKTNV